MEGIPNAIDEQQAIELALRAVCGKSGRFRTSLNDLLRPHYEQRPSYVRQTNRRRGPDTWGWHFWFTFPLPPGFESKAFPVFVNDPSGIVEFGDAI